MGAGAMMASLSIEAIGHRTVQQMRLWSGVLREAGLGACVHRAIGSPSDFKRWGVWEVAESGSQREIHGRTDYSKSNSRGSRGVIIWYQLESGKRYLVKAPSSWKSTDEYTCRVTNAGEIVRG